MRMPRDVSRTGIVFKDAETRATAAQDLDCPPDILAMLANDYEHYPDAAVYALQNPSIPTRILRAHLRHDDDTLLCAVASNPRCPLDILRTLYDRGRTGPGLLRASVLANPTYSHHDAPRADQ